MLMLVLGVLLWALVHSSKRLAPGVRAGIIERIGENPYKGIFSLLIIGSLVLIVFGWRGSVPYSVYRPPQWGHGATVLLMLPALILFVSSNMPTNIKRLLRHPQLAGLALWAIAHLLGNGDRRSVVLFAGLALWAIAEILLINWREGAWQRPPAVARKQDLKPVIIGLVVFAVLAWLHPYFTGMPALDLRF
ncbi:MAG: NnrU family protein [Gammaproteobacteria bacterium]|nr:NnrU family protein [Gammaproteobacteria bacterium]